MTTPAAVLEERLVATHRTVILPEPMPHQFDFISHPARFKIGIMGRRWSKTTAGRAMALVGHGPSQSRRGALYGAYGWWVMPSLPQARETWDALEFALRDVWVRKHATERFFDLPGGGRLQIKSSDEPESLRGSGLDFVVFDELKDHPVRAYKESVRPALSDKHGWFLGIGTAARGHSDDNLASYLFRYAEGRRGWARWQLPSSENPLVTPGELEALREELGPAFARECLAQFEGDDSGIFQAEWFRFYDGSPAFGVPLTAGAEVFRLEECRRYATVDLASSMKTYSDWTVISSWAVTPGGKLVLLDVLRGKIDGAEILDAFKAAVLQWRLDRLYVEKTAYDSKFLALAKREGIEIKEVIRGKGDKIMRAEPAAAAMKRGEIWFPRVAPWLGLWKTELLAFPDKRSKDDQVDTLSDAVAVKGSARSGPLSIQKSPSGLLIPGLDAIRPS